jgi:hypothetical protein
MQNLKINLPFSPKKMYIYSMKKLPLALAVLALVAVFVIGFSLGKTKGENDVIKQQEMELSKVQEEKAKKKTMAIARVDSIMATLPEEQRSKEERNRRLNMMYIMEKASNPESPELPSGLLESLSKVKK